jgi:hypothetical protein
MGQKFKYSWLAGNWRKKELSPALDLLLKASVVHDVRHTIRQWDTSGWCSHSRPF